MSENSVKENSENDVQLTKVKGQKKTQVIDDAPSKIENLENIAVTKPKQEKKPRSEKQKAQFQQVFNKRKEILEKKNLEKKIEASKLLLQHDPEFINKQKIIEPLTPHNDDVVIKKKKEPKIIEMSDSDNDSEESVIIIKKKTSKPKKKKKKIIIEESSDSSSSGEDEEVITLPKPKREFTTQQNKKSIVKIHEKPKVNYDNYFC